ncbi:DMT family transporter [Mesorhizobium sp. BR1-1-16]|uniref:DMT family transporter n=1 Tax=Mesorhizobium sp. BR1-1-16 TaxID=2876653 RepID=UPI001CCD6027|nr:DMT family transporter [Mesorhizobium sp. BR1-1-16]MBZ9937901.1 DMT family transporter [Mesorhizobium sp. BR1-1-16]
MTSFQANFRGISMILLSSLVFILNDTLIKLASDRLPTGQILVMRGGVGLVLILAVLFATGTHRYWRHALHPLVFWRTVGEVVATVLYLYALFHMPIANISAVNQIVPLMTTAAAAIFLGEAVGWRRWSAIAVGFVGVMIVMRPGVAGFDAYALAALGSMAFITLRDLVTRAFPVGMPTLLVTAVTAAAVTLTGGVISLGETWLTPSTHEWVILSGAALLLLVGYGTMILAMRGGSLAVIAPFRYVVILYAITIGYLVWGDIPDSYTIIGTLVVVATGLYSIHRERRVAIVSPSSA